MKEQYKDIYNYLWSISKLEKEEYELLINKYGKDIVNSVIEYMIDEEENNIYKFAYYVELLNLNSDIAISTFDIYMNDVVRIQVLSQEENRMYSNEIYEIIQKIRNIFGRFDYDYVKQSDVIFNSIVDEIDFYLTNPLDEDSLEELKMLRKRFINVRNILVEGNLRLVVSAMKCYFKDRKSFLECIQYGNIGLMRAVEKYNPYFNTAFSTYSYYWIRQSYRAMIRNALKTATSISYRAMEINSSRLKVVEELTMEYGRVPTSLEIASKMGIGVKQLEELEKSFLDGISLFARISVSKSEDESVEVIDVIADRNVDVENDVCNKELKPEIMKILDDLLNERQKYIILNRFGFYGEVKTLQQIGDELGVSRQCVEQIQVKALTKIKRVAGNKLADFLD